MTSPTGGGSSTSDDEVGRADVAKQEAAQVTGTVQEQGAAVTGAVQEAAQRVAGETSAQVANLAGEAGRQFREVLDRSQGEFDARATEQADKASGQLKELAAELRALVDGRPEDAPRATGYLGQAAQQVEGYAGRLDSGGFAGVADDVGRFARRRPGTFLLGAVAAGFAAGRLARGAQAAGRDDTSSTAPPRSATGGTSTGWVAPTSPPRAVSAPPLVIDRPTFDDAGLAGDSGLRGDSGLADDSVMVDGSAVPGGPGLGDRGVASPGAVAGAVPPQHHAGPNETGQR